MRYIAEKLPFTTHFIMSSTPQEKLLKGILILGAAVLAFCVMVAQGDEDSFSATVAGSAFTILLMWGGSLILTRNNAT